MQFPAVNDDNFFIHLQLELLMQFQAVNDDKFINIPASTKLLCDTCTTSAQRRSCYTNVLCLLGYIYNMELSD